MTAARSSAPPALSSGGSLTSATTARSMSVHTAALPGFSIGGLKDAVFNLRNLPDGRATNDFNAAAPFGPADARADVLVVTGNTLGRGGCYHPALRAVLGEGLGSAAAVRGDRRESCSGLCADR